MNAQSNESFGLIAWLENTRIVLPLKGVEASFNVRGDLVSVELSQLYYQSHSQPLDVLYTFPLPTGAAVYRCEMIVNGRVICAKVMEQNAARLLAAEKNAAGHRTALVESVRENLFELELGNLAPGDTAIIRMAWFQTLDTAGHDRSFRIPFTPGVRYIPGTPLLRSNASKGTGDDTDQVPDASRLTPPRIDSLHPDAAWASVEGRIELEGVDAGRIASPSHTLVLREENGAVTARLAGNGEVPDRDFVLRLPIAPSVRLTPAAWTAVEDGACHALVRIIAPDTVPATTAPRDVYFLVDRSGSMAGANWTATCKAFRAFLGNLVEHDRAWVTFFESSFRDLAEEPLPPAAILAEPVVQNLEQWPVGGGTELLPALLHVLEALRKHSAERQPVVVLITDGQVGNEQAIIEHMKTFPEVPVFCYGIDRAVNDAFLRRLASQQRGACFLATPQDDLVGTIAGLAARLRHPVLTHIEPPAGWELPAGAIPDLHAGECLTVSLRGPAGAELPGLSFHAADANGKSTTLTCPVRAATDPALTRLWAKQRIEHLLDTGRATEAIELSTRSNLICRLTAFIAWDESERIAITGPRREIYQPAMLRAARYSHYGFCMMKASSMPAMDFDDDDFAPAPSIPAAPTRRFPGALCKEVCIDAPAPMPDPELFQSPPSAEAPLIQMQRVSVWRKKLRELTRMPLPEALLDLLDQWLQSVPAVSGGRESQLEALAEKLSLAPDPVHYLCGWINRHMSSHLCESALRLAASLAVTPP